MNNNNTPFNSYDILFLEYIRLTEHSNNSTRETNSQLLNLLNTYLTILNTQVTQQNETSNNIRSLLQRYYENFRTQQYEERNSDRIREHHNRNLRRRNNIWELNNRSRNTDNYIMRNNDTNRNSDTRRNNYSQRNISTWRNPPLNRRVTTFNRGVGDTQNTQNTARINSNISAPSFSFPGLSRRRATTRDAFTRILNETLTLPTRGNPITRERVNQVTTRNLWEEIYESVDQFICPITRERFQNSDYVLRINHCGHVFNENALVTYLTEHDHRCPVCRFNLRETISSNLPENTTDNTTNSTNTTDPFSATPLASFSFSLPTTLPPLNNLNPSPVTNSNNNTNTTTNNVPTTDQPSNTNTNTNNITDLSANTFNFNNPLNLQNIMSGVVNELTTALNDPSIINTTNGVSAEYSFFLPPSVVPPTSAPPRAPPPPPPTNEQTTQTDTATDDNNGSQDLHLE